MLKHTDRVRIEEVDWPAVFPWLRLFASVRAALHPTKLLTALLLVITLYLLGQALDMGFGRSVAPGEFDQFRQQWFGLRTTQQLDDWRQGRDAIEREAIEQLLAKAKVPKAEIDAIVADGHRVVAARYRLDAAYRKLHADTTRDEELLPGDINWKARFKALREARAGAMRTLASLQRAGPFDASCEISGGAIDRLMRGIATLNLGWSQVVAAPPAGAPDPADVESTTPAGSIRYYDQASVLSALTDLFVILPAWLWQQHRGFLLSFLLLALLAVQQFGGAIARMAALHGTRDERIGFRPAFAFANEHVWSFLLAPLLPIGIIAATALLMGLGGLVFFGPKEWAIDIIGAIFFAAAILCGFIVAATLLLSALGVHLVFSAIAVDGADVFDAYARAFHYLLNRAVRWVCYTLLALLAGAIAYLVFALLLFLTAWAVHRFVGLWLITETTMGDVRWDVVFPPPAFGRINGDIDFAALDWSSRIAARIVRAWMFITASLMTAFVVSYYFTANTWIYLLLRKSADGIETEDVALNGTTPREEKNAAPDKVEPPAPAPDAAPPTNGQ